MEETLGFTILNRGFCSFLGSWVWNGISPPVLCPTPLYASCTNIGSSFKEDALCPTPLYASCTNIGVSFKEDAFRTLVKFEKVRPRMANGTGRNAGIISRSVRPTPMFSLRHIDGW
jgi:hypothetical protein